MACWFDASMSLFAQGGEGGLPWIWIIVGVAVLLGLFGVMIYNSLVNVRMETQNAWAQIDVQLKRRHDLIPNLVETVKGYAKHEQGTLEKVIQARNAAVERPGHQQPDRGRESAERRPPPTVCPLRSISGPEGEPKLHQPARRTDGD